MMRRLAIVLAVSLGTAGLGAQGGGQQQPPPRSGESQQQQQQAQQQQAQQQLQHMMQRMEHVATRAQQLSETMTRDIERLRVQDRDQVRLIQQLCDAVGAQARDTQRSMDRIQLMLQDRTLSQDRDMQRDVDRLRDRLNTVTDGLQDMVTTMEQMHKRLQSRTPAGS